MATKRVSREELYEQVWKTPMSRLASDYGVSDVALAKTCTRMNMPRPGRGYWARLGAGEKLERPALPQAQPNDDLYTYVRDPRPASATLVTLPRVPRVPPPSIAVPRTLRAAHPAIVELGAALATAKRDEHERLVVPGIPAPVLVISVDAHRRALLLLDGLAKGLEGRGHAVAFGREGDRFSLQANVNGMTIGISISEHLERSEHVPNAEEQERIKSGYDFGIPKYEYDTGGRLQLLLHGTTRRATWSDTDTRRLEGSLGAVVVVAEVEVEQRRLLRLAEEQRRVRQEQERLDQEAERRREEVEEQRRREQQAEERRQALIEAQTKYTAAITKDLEEMAARWANAAQVRAFLAAIRIALADSERDAQLEEWLVWADSIAGALDPLSRPGGIAKPLQVENNGPST
jgi:hypothetical protein